MKFTVRWQKKAFYRDHTACANTRFCGKGERRSCLPGLSRDVRPAERTSRAVRITTARINSRENDSVDDSQLHGRQAFTGLCDGMQIRDWLHCDDHCSAQYAVLTRGASGEVYNIGGKQRAPQIWISYVSSFVRSTRMKR
jgi:hypothetical protein